MSGGGEGPSLPSDPAGAFPTELTSSSITSISSGSGSSSCTECDEKEERVLANLRAPCLVNTIYGLSKKGVRTVLKTSKPGEMVKKIDQKTKSRRRQLSMTRNNSKLNQE